MGVLREIAKGMLAPRRSLPARPKVLILTPAKDCGFIIPKYCRRLLDLTYPKRLISVGFLESDSRDETFEQIERNLPLLRRAFRRAELWKKDFGFRIPHGAYRWTESLQLERRVILARSRNRLLSNALADEDWVLWLDADVVEYPRDILETLLAGGKDILQPHCVIDPGGPTFDRNAWRYEERRLFMEDLRGRGDFVELDAVGGTMLLVRADLHREGLLFPAFAYQAAQARIPGAYPETEGLGLLAYDMGHRCWGMPHLEIRHGNW